MNFRSRGDESIASPKWPTHGFASGHQSAACVRYPQVHWKGSSCKTRDQVVPQPTIETLTALPGSEPLNPIA